MPEGDAVVRTARRLDEALRGAVLVRAELRWPDVATVDLVGRTVLGTVTHGKHLLTRFDDGRTLHTHLRMDGSWRVVPAGRPHHDPEVRALLGSRTQTALGLLLGVVEVVTTAAEHTLIGHLGPDVLADDFPTNGLPEALRRLGRTENKDAGTGGVLSSPIGQVLLDQRNIAGLGTLWVAESLWTRRIWPWTAVADVPDPASLLMAARRLMERSLVPGGADRGARPGAGTAVHQREGRPCPRCATPIRAGRVGRQPFDRPMFWCPVCQAPDGRSPAGV